MSWETIFWKLGFSPRFIAAKRCPVFCPVMYCLWCLPSTCDPDIWTILECDDMSCQPSLSSPLCLFVLPVLEVLRDNEYTQCNPIARCHFLRFVSSRDRRQVEFHSNRLLKLSSSNQFLPQRTFLAVLPGVLHISSSCPGKSTQGKTGSALLVYKVFICAQAMHTFGSLRGETLPPEQRGAVQDMAPSVIYIDQVDQVFQADLPLVPIASNSNSSYNML